MAVSRRQKENDTFNDIASTLPIEESAKELDKASVLRIAIHYLKLRDVLADCETENHPEEISDTDALHSVVPNFSKDVLQALDGFLMLISKDGQILFATDSISQYLGLRQVDVIGVHIQDIIHPQDYSEVAAVFQSQGCDIGPEMEASLRDPLRRNFVVRMRCAFTPSVRSITRCSNFKPIYCSGFLKFSNKKVKEGEFIGMVMLCKLASVMKVKELCVGAFFKTKHTLDLGYTAVDTRIRWILGFDPAEMVGLKAYEYFHPGDLMATSSCHTTLLAKGRSHSPCYRFMARSGEWVWVRSKSSVTYDAITHLPNGLSIYTWIVRYDEEDDRMKAITAGKDPGNLGVKDTSALVTSLSSSSGSLNIQELCNPNSSNQQTHKTTNHNVKTELTSLASDLVSPELAPQPPPNINPFQSYSSPTTSPSYESTPNSSVGSGQDPFMGASLMSTGSHKITTPMASPGSFPFANQQREASPPYSTTSGNSYSTPTSSPSTSLNRGSMSPTEVCYYNNYQSPPTHSDRCHLSYNPVPPPQSSYMPTFAVDTTAVFVTPADYMTPTQLDQFNIPQQLPHDLPFPHLKQEPPTLMGGGAGYYDGFTSNYSSCSFATDRMHRSSARINEVKSRYSKVGVAGGHNKLTRGIDADACAAINDISEWLQHSVH